MKHQLVKAIGTDRAERGVVGRGTKWRIDGQHQALGQDLGIGVERRSSARGFDDGAHLGLDIGCREVDDFEQFVHEGSKIRTRLHGKKRTLEGLGTAVFAKFRPAGCFVGSATGRAFVVCARTLRP